MRKIIIYILSLITVCFIIPSIFSKNNNIIQTSEEKIQDDSKDNTKNNINNEIIKKDDGKENKENKIENNKYSKIKLLHKKSKIVEDVNLEEYLCNVVSAEMPVIFEKEALKAQAIVARTYTIYKIQNKKHEQADICDDFRCCQSWISKEDRLKKWEESKKEENWKKISCAVNETKGKIITYEGKPINAFFHSNSGGKTEIPVNVWGGNNFPYLQVIETSGEDGYNQYKSNVEYGFDDIVNKLKVKYNDININFKNDDDIKILEYTESGRVKTIKFGNHKISGVEARSIFKLKSTNFSIKKTNDKIKFQVKGYGHGVGMSQTGADSLAKQGKNCDDIIKHFYKNIEIKDISQIP